jgi:ATP-dependent protease ClpP protease subunit
MNNLNALRSINWNRAIFVNEEINDELVKKLTPTILLMRQESNLPITIGIDSPGGSLSSLDTLLGLLTGPCQNGDRGKIITVSTNRAYSSAANLLAFGDYSVALDHSTILFHDVRFSGIRDVTPGKALSVAKSLKEVNDTFALRLAHKIIKRLVWIYIDLEKEFQNTNEKYSSIHTQYDKVINSFTHPTEDASYVDIASFATCLYAKSSTESDELISNVMSRLSRWIILSKLSNSAPSYRAKRSRKPGLLDGIRHMYELLDGSPDILQASEHNLKLLLTLLAGEITSQKSPNAFQQHLEAAVRDFTLMQSMNDSSHTHSAIRLMLEHDHVFLGTLPNKTFKDKPDEEQKKILEIAMPRAQLFWLFCALLCRELFEGEHILKPHDAQLFGLIDEVTGGGPVESRREFSFRTERSAE